MLGTARRGLRRHTLQLRRRRFFRSRLRGGRRNAGAGAQAAKQRSDFNSVAFIGDDVREITSLRSRHFDRHFVCFQLDQNIILRDRVAGLLQPFRNGRLGDGLPERGTHDISHCIRSNSVLGSARGRTRRSKAWRAVYSIPR